jgi:hypothetical protein
MSNGRLTREYEKRGHAAMTLAWPLAYRGFPQRAGRGSAVLLQIHIADTVMCLRGMVYISGQLTRVSEICSSCHKYSFGLARVNFYRVSSCAM